MLLKSDSQYINSNLLSLCTTYVYLNMSCIMQCVSSTNTKQPDMIILKSQFDWTVTNCMMMINNQNIPYQHNLIQENNIQ